MILADLQDRKLIHPPPWLPDNCMYLTYVGSVAYGVSELGSDMDVSGFCIPPKDVVFPHLAGEIMGFGRQKKRFNQWQEHHVTDPFYEGKQWDFVVFSIVKYFQLCMENNPNMVDTLFTNTNMIIHNTQVGQMVREGRKLFLHRGCWHKFKGYAYSQVTKMGKTNHKEGTYRHELVQKYGYDLKAAYHVVRLIDEVDQLLTTGDLNLTRDKARLKAIRAGEWTMEQVRDYFMAKEKSLETAYENSPLPYKPKEEPLKELLLQCLEHHYGSLENALARPDREREALMQIYIISSEGLGQ